MSLAEAKPWRLLGSKAAKIVMLRAPELFVLAENASETQGADDEHDTALQTKNVWC
jgi:hypothetical protein